MRWITDENLKTWAERTDARELFIDLVGDLIRASVSDVTKFRFPGQSAGTLRGFDGDLEVRDDAPKTRVPVGPSKWEFGTSPTGKAKAEADYSKRTKGSTDEMMKQNAFVMLNLHNWDTPTEPLAKWEAEKNAEGKWREVHFMDGTVLQKWLEEKPAVAARYARNVLGKAPANGAMSTDEFWALYSEGFKPKLMEDVLLAGREEEAKRLLDVLAGGPQNFTIAAENAEEAIAFAVAAVRTAPEDIRRLLEAKTMIVETADAAQFLNGKTDMVYLVWRGAEGWAGSLGQRGPTLTIATGVARKRQGLMQLRRPSASAMAVAMGKMNIERQEAYELAKKCGRSLVILRRLKSASGVYPDPDWAGQANVLKPAFLAGGWTTNSELDKEVVASLGGKDYQAVETPVRETLTLSDPPFDRADQVWQVRAAVDAFPYYGHLIDEADLARFKDAAVKVFGHQVPQPKPEERFSFEYKAPADYSSWLRDGLAQTLNLIAVLPGLGGLQFNGTTPQQYVDDVVRSLPEYAKSHRWILPILDQLSAVAEAAPIPFLEALEKSLEGENCEALNFFQEADRNDFLFHKTSPHVYVLWALEVLAWDPTYLTRAAVLLAKLGRIDAKATSNNGNRPLSSLRSIFIAWSPNTDADLNKRFKALDTVLREVPEVAWEVLLSVAPRSHDTSSPTAQPRLRDTTPLNPEAFTFGLVWETESQYLDRTVELAKGREDRLVQLVSHLTSYQHSARESLVKAFEEELAKSEPPVDRPLWHALHGFVAQHESYPDTDWSLKGEELGRIKALVEKHKPTDLIAQARHLFDDWFPRLGADYQRDMEEVELVRADALKQVHAEMGTEGLLHLAKAVKLPRLMGPALEKLELTFEESAHLIFELIKAGGECYDLGCLVSGNQRRKKPDDWGKFFEKNVLTKTESLRDAACLLSTWPADRTTWDYVDQLGAAVAETYWKEAGSIPFNGTENDRAYAIDRLRAVGRSLRVIVSLHQKIEGISSHTLLHLLDESVKEISELKEVNSMLTYAISDVFETLSKRNDMPPIEVAGREYTYLNLIEHSVKGLAVYKVLATNPAEYIDILCHVYGAKNSPPAEEVTEQMRAHARMSYRLLKAFHTVPGADDNGVIDGAVLREWVLKAREIAVERDRAEIADEYIGQLLAHSKPEADTGIWPQPTVAGLLDEIASEKLERGIQIERFNMRGAYWRGDGEGGASERSLAATYRAWGEKTASPRAGAMLEEIAKGWDDSARRADIRSEQEMLKR